MSYTVKCCVGPIENTCFYTFPTGCRVSGGSLTRRSKLVAIPYADGEKETADGKLGGGDVSVTGRIWASSGEAAIALIKTMEELLALTGKFYILQDYGSSRKFYPVHCCKSAAHTLVDGTGGLWIDIDCVFPRGPDPAMVSGV